MLAKPGNDVVMESWFNTLNGLPEAWTGLYDRLFGDRFQWVMIPQSVAAATTASALLEVKAMIYNWWCWRQRLIEQES